jgi:hypothetical protein
MNMRVPITPWHAVGCPFVAGQEAWPAQHLRAPQQKNLPCHETFDLRQTVVARARIGLRKRLHLTRR